MAKPRTAYQCNACGTQLSKWAGQCPECHEWNSLEEVRTAPAAANRHGGYAGDLKASQVTGLADVALQDAERLSSGIEELDRVLGGGIVAGSVVLIGGDPGIGKSTLLLQLLAAVEDRAGCLYVTGEESLQQVGLRARRLELDVSRLRCVTETCVERILQLADQEKPQCLVIDSIQTVYSEQLQSAPGAVAQVRESAARLVRYAKATRTAVFLVGHVTKEGALAGPRVLEHMVDAVLYFEADSGSRYRVIRAVKNRFGAINELGVFAMTDRGLRQVSNPSALFLAGHAEPAPGSAVLVTREGSRPLLVEVQALADASHLANPRRVAVGIDHNRLAMLLAVMHRHAGVQLGDQDVFVNVVGGLKIAETAADLATALAIHSSLTDRPLPPKLVSFGEVGLSGEIRPVYNGEERLKEAAVQGYELAIVARSNAPRAAIEGLNVVPVASLSAALRQIRELG